MAAAGSLSGLVDGRRSDVQQFARPEEAEPTGVVQRDQPGQEQTT